MRYSGEEYEVGEVWVNKETGERFICIGLDLCEDTYYDVVYTISEEEFIQNRGKEVKESDIESFNTIENYNIDDYDRIKGKKYKIYSEIVYSLDCE